MEVKREYTLIYFIRMFFCLEKLKIMVFGTISGNFLLICPRNLNYFFLILKTCPPPPPIFSKIPLLLKHLHLLGDCPEFTAI